MPNELSALVETAIVVRAGIGGRRRRGRSLSRGGRSIATGGERTRSAEADDDSPHIVNVYEGLLPTWFYGGPLPRNGPDRRSQRRSCHEGPFLLCVLRSSVWAGWAVARAWVPAWARDVALV